MFQIKIALACIFICIQYFGYSNVNDADSLRKVAISLKNKGYYDSAKSICQQSIELFNQAGDSVGLGNALNNLGIIYYRMGDYFNGLETYLLSIEINKSINNQETLVKNYLNLGNLLVMKEEYESALDTFNKGLNSGNYNKTIEGYLLLGKSNSFMRLMRYDSAIQYFNNTKEIFVEMGDTKNVALVEMDIGHVYQSLGDYTRSEEHYLRSLNAFEEIRNRQRVLPLHLNLGTLYRASLNDYEKAEYHYLKGIRVAEDLSHAKYYLDFVFNLSKLKIQMKQPEEAEGWFNKMKVMLDSIDRMDRNKDFAELHVQYEVDEVKSALEEQKRISTALSKENFMILLTSIFGLAILSSLYIVNRIRIRSIRLEKKKMEVQNKIDTLNSIGENLERERKRFSRDLHDRIGAKLSTLKIFHKTEPGSNRTDKLLGSIIREMREISHDYHSGILERLGVEPAIRDLIENISMSGAFEIEHDIRIKRELPKELERELFFIINELFNNAIKYSKANMVSVILFEDQPGKIILIFEDDGVGFNKEEASDGIGLKNIESRLLKFDGNMEIDSTPGKGSSIITEFSLGDK